jgi:hypothetical protein
MMMTLVVSKPFPNLSNILAFVREQYGFIRLLVLSFERSPKELIEDLQKKKDGRGTSDLSVSDSVDVYELLRTIQTASYNSIVVDGTNEFFFAFFLFLFLVCLDFLPMSISYCMEPFFQSMGYGNFYIRPNPFCG